MGAIGALLLSDKAEHDKGKETVRKVKNALTALKNNGLISSKRAQPPPGHLSGIFSLLLPHCGAFAKEGQPQGWGIVKNNLLFRTFIKVAHGPLQCVRTFPQLFHLRTRDDK